MSYMDFMGRTRVIGCECGKVFWACTVAEEHLFQTLQRNLEEGVWRRL